MKHNYLQHFITLFLTAFLILPAFVNAQVITTDPPFPTMDQPVTITFDASESTRGELEGYTGNMYVHTGVIVEPGGSWQYVIGDWGNNNNQPQAENVGEDLWELHIEDIRGFYSLPSSVETVHQLAIVFRSSNGSQQSEDLFVDIFDDLVSVRIDKPSTDPLNPFFAELGQEVDIEVVAAASEGELSSVKLFVNDELVAEGSDEFLAYTYTVSSEGRTEIRATAENSDGAADEDSIYIIVNPEVTDQSRPSGILDGINYHDGDDSKVTLSIFAPYKDFIYVIGDFNDWEVDPDYFMKRDQISEDKVHYWIEIDGLTPGQEYGFQYLIDGNLRVADAYTEKVLDPWHDQEIINQGRYPGLIPYPHGMTVNPVSVLQTAREPYQWQTNDFEPPAVEDLVIYELLIRDFLESPHNTYATLRDTLDYLENLGVNAIELMPVNQFEGNLSWGYNPSFFFAADKYYGPRRELKKFIDEAHSRGIAVILDMVWNHSWGQSPLLRMYYDSANNRPADNNPWYMDYIFENPAMNFGYKFDHGSEHFIEFMDRANAFWMEEFRVDGFRFDLTKGFTTQFKGPSDPWGSNYDQERVDNLIRLRDALHAVNPNAYVILEHLADNSEETVLANEGMMLWGNLNHNYNEATMGWVSGNNSDLSWGYHGNRGWNDPHLITYMESHDEQRLMWKNLQYGNSGPGHDVRELDVALSRIKTAAAFFFTIPGPKMIWQFGELGYDYGLGEDGRGRTDPMPVPWDEYLPNQDRVDLYNAFRALIKLKTENEVFRTSDVSMNLGPAVKRIYLNHETMNVAIIGNFDVNERTVAANMQHTGQWWDYFSGEAWNFNSTDQQITLGPGEFHIFSTQKIDLPDDITFTSINDDRDQELPEAFNLHQNYPNPFNPSTNVSYTMGEAGHVTIQVYNVVGQRVATLVNETRPAGTHTVQFDGSRLSSGMYLVRMQADGQVFTNKMMLVK